MGLELIAMPVDQKIQVLVNIKEHLAKFVPLAARRLVEANPEAPELEKRERDVSVLFLDVSGYTRLSQRLTPEALNTLVERYFSTFLDRIQEAAGKSRPSTGDSSRYQLRAGVGWIDPF